MPQTLAEQLAAALRTIRDFPAGENSDPNVMGAALEEIRGITNTALSLVPPRIVVFVRGGVVMNAVADKPAEVIVMDYDAEVGGRNTVLAPSYADAGKRVTAALYLEPCTVATKYVDEVFSLV